jgi:protein involved in polysaccharide export with SLBB domain
MRGRQTALVAVCLAVLAGCAGRRDQLRQALRTDHLPAAHTQNLPAHYLVRCPDVLEVQVEGAPACSGRRPVGPDGRIELAPGLSVRVAGLSALQARSEAARRLGLPLERVNVRVAEYKSQQLYLVGEVDAVHQVVAYRGPESVLDLLQRVGLASGAELGDIRVVRAHVADGKPPEVFPVDLQAILMKHDQQTNVLLEPFDHVHIGQRRPSRLADCVPPLLRPLYRDIWGVK